jgi:hypothetical protein
MIAHNRPFDTRLRRVRKDLRSTEQGLTSVGTFLESLSERQRKAAVEALTVAFDAGQTLEALKHTPTEPVLQEDGKAKLDADTAAHLKEAATVQLEVSALRCAWHHWLHQRSARYQREEWSNGIAL